MAHNASPPGFHGLARSRREPNYEWVFSMLSNLIDVSGWSHEQWLAVSILGFIVVTLIVVLARLVKIVKMSRRRSYQPNLRPLRRRR